MGNSVGNKLYTLLLILLTTSLFASDDQILTAYRLNGIEKIEKELDKTLTNTSYWKKFLKNKDTKFGYMESYKNILLCDKTKSALLMYTKDNNNRYQLNQKYNALTGKIKGDKLKEGDLKTPVGVYDIVKKLSEVDSFYGPMAFVTSYPNLYDRYRGKTGQGIWIHGLPTHQKRDNFTKGCIAIDNKSLESLDENLDIKQTVLIIKEETDSNNTLSKETLAKLLSELYAWRYAWIYNDLDNYLNFYAQEFKRYDGMDFASFKKYKERIFKKNERKKIIFQKINIVAYPNRKNLYKITFYEKYKSESYSFNGPKVLIAKLQNNKLHIITEK